MSEIKKYVSKHFLWIKIELNYISCPGRKTPSERLLNSHLNSYLQSIVFFLKKEGKSNIKFNYVKFVITSAKYK